MAQARHGADHRQRAQERRSRLEENLAFVSFQQALALVQSERLRLARFLDPARAEWARLKPFIPYEVLHAHQS
jgi:hypothetical protein